MHVTLRTTPPRQILLMTYGSIATLWRYVDPSKYDRLRRYAPKTYIPKCLYAGKWAASIVSNTFIVTKNTNYNSSTPSQKQTAWCKNFTLSVDCNAYVFQRSEDDTIACKPSNLLWKTAICQHWKAGQCTQGADCPYAHGQSELRQLPKFSLCSKFLKGECPHPSSKVICHWCFETLKRWKQCSCSRSKNSVHLWLKLP